MPRVYSRAANWTHWVGVACVAILLMSGLQIFNAHPALYLGQASRFEHPVVSIRTAEKDGREIGVTDILGQRFNTTGVLGLSGKDNSDEHAFPAWAAHVHESAQRFHESAQPWNCPAGAALEVAAHTAPRGGVCGRRLTLVAF